MYKKKSPIEERDFVHPVAILKQAAAITSRNLKLGAVYLIFSLPIAVFSLSPAANPDKKPGMAVFLWLLLVIIIDSWGKIALLLSANRAIESRDYGIVGIINQSGQFLVRYLGLVLSVFLLTLLTLVFGLALTSLSGALLWGFSKIAAGAVLFILLFGVIGVLVFFLLRWSLASVVCVLEDKGLIGSLKQSFFLVKDHVNPLVATYMLMGLIYLVSIAPLLAIAALQGKNISEATPGVGANTYNLLINIFLVPLGTVFIILLYKKLKEISERNVHA